MKNTNNSNTDRCGIQTVKRNTMVTQDYMSSTPLFLSLSLSRSWGHSKTSNPCSENKILNPDVGHYITLHYWWWKNTNPTYKGRNKNQYIPRDYTTNPQPLRCTHHFQLRERETREDHCLNRRPTSKSPQQNFSTQKRYTTLTPLPLHSFRSFTEHSTIEPAIVITADPYTPNRLTLLKSCMRYVVEMPINSPL
jgi:hypothetical protein